MPAASVLAPSALLAAAAALGGLLELAGVRVSRWLAASAAWLALLALLGTWAAVGRATLELNLPGTLAAAPLALRLDPIGVAFGLVVLLPAALLLSFQPRSSAEASVGALAASASLLATEAGSVLLTAVALGACASLMLIALRLEEDRPTATFWISMSAGGLLLLWAATALEVAGGTSLYSAAPVTALGVPVFLLLAAAGLLSSGILPWPTWLPSMWDRDRLQAGSLAIALLSPLGFLLLTRAYLLGAGHWPSAVLNLLLAAVGVLAALAAALRAQAARSRHAFLAEAVPLSGGLALLALALGTPLGVSAAVLALTGSALVAGLAPLLPGPRWPSAVLGVVVILGVPPALVFGGRLLAIQAAVEAGGPLAYLGLAGVLAWLLSLAAAARLPALAGEAEGETAHGLLGARLALILALLAGLAIGLIETLLALPVAAEASGSARPLVTGGFAAVVTASGGWPALTLAGPLLLLGLALAVVTRPAWRRWPARPVALRPPPPPLLGLTPLRLDRRLRGFAADLRLPEQYRSLLDPSALEAAAAASRPWLWGAITLALIVVVTR